MYFHEIGHNRYRVHKDKNDHKFYGTIEKQEYVSIDASTGKRVTKRFWKVDGATGGWRDTSKKLFPTREAAGAFLIKDGDTPYFEKKTQWVKKQGESAVLKAAKAGA